MLGYAVIDCETTGLNIRGNDRIIEIAVVLLDEKLNITGQYETVLNPERDLGLVSMHGIDGLIASHGVSFKEIMPSLSKLLHDRVIIGHNVNYDIGMFKAEYDRENISPIFGTPVDTLTLAKFLPLNVKNYKLETLCRYFHIHLVNSHQAMADTLATAQLLITMLDAYQCNVNCYPADFSASSMSDDLSGWKKRDDILQKIAEPADLNNFMLNLSNSVLDLPEKAIDIYLKAMHLALINDRFSSWEKTTIEEIIFKFGLTKGHVIDLNEEYIFMLICKNLMENNGKWHKDSISQKLSVVTSFTGIKDIRVEELLRDTLQQSHLIEPTVKKLNSYFSFVAGDSFVVTGEDFKYDKAYWVDLLSSRGFVSKPSTTKATKLILAGDPYSLSAKAVTARRYGIPVIAESTMSSMLKILNQ